MKKTTIIGTINFLIEKKYLVIALSDNIRIRVICNSIHQNYHIQNLNLTPKPTKP